jgi:primosomal protein N' (replication factor Y) (superfamily II helicase)
MPLSQLYIDLILPLPLSQLFTYKVPDEYAKEIAVGKRVLVQFGAKKYYTAIISQVHNTVPTGDYEIKEILSIIDYQPVVNDIQLRFWNWIAEYYMSPIGDVMKAALPAGLKLESESMIFPNLEFEASAPLPENESTVYDLLCSKKELSISDLHKIVNKKNILQTIKSLYEKEAVYIEERMKAGFKPKKETYIRLAPQAAEESYLHEMLDKLEKAKKQKELLTNYLQLSGAFEESEVVEVTKKILLESSGAGAASLKSLIEKGVLEPYQKEISRLNASQISKAEISQLTEKQSIAYSEIKKIFENKDVALLHGVTSSGKTEIYLHLINETIEQGRQVLYILPEIAITAQIINRLKEHFGNKVGIYHSKFSDNERVEIWNRLNKPGDDGYNIILGVRSSVFLPFENLGLIVVDEEHENTFKQYDPSPRYNARDVAIVLAKMHNAKVLLGSATPSVESYYNANSGRYGLVNLMERFSGIKLPEVKLVNMCTARKKGHVRSHFSNILLDAIELTISKEKQVILFQNRRGFSPFIECPECGWIPKCRHCDVTLTYHKYQNQLVCHYCGFSHAIPDKCPSCSNTGLQTIGFGTEKIEEELSLIYPSIRVSRMDLDSTRTKHAHEDIISAFENHKVDVLVGTQMVTKGLDFANVGLVGILNADNMINFPDFRAFERSFQLMVQVAGRSGRKDERGLVIIQTSTPGHPIIKNVLDNDYLSMYNEQIAERRQFKYPPFYRFVQLTIKHRNVDSCINASNILATNLRTTMGNRVIGPDKPVVGRIQNLYLRNVFIKIERNAAVGEIKKEILGLIDKTTGIVKSLQVSIDVDPM